MNVVFIIPTGIGCEIGGHNGDASPAAKLIASVCDKLIVHPNVVNASDINEMTENMLYVEGSMLDRFLEGEILLKEVYSNKILVVTNAPLKTEVINSVSAARVTIGCEAEILVLDKPLEMIGGVAEGKPIAEAKGMDDLINQVQGHNFDALAITTPITVGKYTKLNYCENGGINPYGYVEAVVSRDISKRLNKPAVHSPVENSSIEEQVELNIITDPRIAPELVSVSYLHCILKGLHKAPRPSKSGLSVDDIDLMISPMCWGPPHFACTNNDIPIIMVKENKTICHQSGFEKLHPGIIYAENYLEAAGVISAIKSGISLESLRRPINKTKIINK